MCCSGRDDQLRDGRTWIAAGRCALMWCRSRLAGRSGLGNADIVALSVPERSWTRFLQSRRLLYRVTVGGNAVAGGAGRGALVGVLIPCVTASVTHASDQVT